MAEPKPPTNTGTGTGFRNRGTKQRTEDLSNYVFGKVQPQATPLEEAVLGALMLDKDALSVVLDILRPPSFYLDAHQLIYSAMLRLFERSQPIDLLTVMEELKKSGDLESIGGPAYLAELTNRVASAANIEFHARIIAQKHIQRELIGTSTKIIRDAFEDTTDVFQLLDEAEQGLFSIAQQNMRRSYESISTLAAKAIKQLEELKHKEHGLTGVPTGFTELDRLTSGWQPSDLIIVAARPAMGKTSFVLSLARNAAVDFGKGVAIFSLEMSSLQLAQRLISMEAEISGSKMRNAQLEDYQWQQLHSAIQRIGEAPIFIDDTAGINVFELRAKCRRMKLQHDIQLVVIDYLQLMSGGSDNQRGNREQEVSAISRALKGMAKELSVPVVALSQLSRAVEVRGGSKRPQLSDLRESGCLTGDTLIQDANTGARIPIKMLADNPENYPLTTLAINSQQELRPYTLVKAFYAGQKPVFELITKTGRRIKASGNHPFYTHLGWQPLDQLRTSIHIGVAEAIEIQNPSNPLDASDLILLANSIGTSSALPGQTTLDKRLPDLLFECDNQLISLFLYHLWATGGKKSQKTLSGKKTSGAIYYSSNSQTLALQIQHLLCRLGIFSVLKTVEEGELESSYQVCIEDSKNQLSFLQQEDCIVSEGINAFEDFAQDTHAAFLMAEVGTSLISPVLSAKNERRLEFYHHAGNSPADLVLQNNISTKTQNRLKQHTEAPEPTKPGIFWDEIVAINPLGIQDVYDATVPGVHNFLANDIIVHNSIEQDADIVSFIYRPEYYGIIEDEEGQSLKGVSEIIVAKNRHGAAKTVKLRFTDEFARFSDLDDPNFDDLPSGAIEGPYTGVITRPSRMNEEEDIPF